MPSAKPGWTKSNREAAAAATEVVAVLEPEIGVLASVDPAGFTEAIGSMGMSLLARPAELWKATARYAAGMTSAAMAGAVRAVGVNAAGPVSPDRLDSRFADPAWETNPWFFSLEQAYLLWARLMSDLVAAAELSEPHQQKAEFAIQALVDALAPTNVLAGNPVALRKAVDTGGWSVLRGLSNFYDDLANNHGLPRQVDTSPFTLGVNLAATPGKVVYRNELMELIQYEPQTETTFEVPLLLSPAWINKYYLLDLSPGRSFVEWAVSHGHTTFAISYRNPDESMRDVALDDYLIHGPHTALDVIADITGQPQANIVGVCLGGTLTAMLLAYLAGTGEDRIRSATLLNTLVDFSEPGIWGTFADSRTVARFSQQMARRGYVGPGELAVMFNMLRPRELVWNYVASNWLMGEQPPAYDLLAWNADGIRMPGAMHAYYLRYCHVENQLARGEMILAGTRLHLEDIAEEVYLLAARNDHICAWTSQYKTTQLLRHARFVLGSSGHVAGIVNPPHPKAHYWTNDNLPADARAWLADAVKRESSWWQDWAAWISQRSGGLRPPPATGSTKYPPLTDAPGTYVRDE